MSTFIFIFASDLTIIYLCIEHNPKKHDHENNTDRNPEQRNF